MIALPATFAALSDPTRLAILSRLAQGEASVNDLAALFPISQPAISRHLKVLDEAGLIERRVDGTRRPCRLNPQALAPVRRWISDLERVMEANYARLDALLAPSERTPDAPDT
ncbi:ArsR/SmtB family transcription factor [Pararhodobacter aggregans]|uniref:Transcriptional regulator n=1 Tax=Pararhodobacter aggregans TaxID=404875 RepID=A0A2T7UJX0_9RHOB|nr:metalloregulator ArsR/SmtB family transcription factor [Pararhodobacter aggregans]PTW98947.1 ArsR family transcriptional regulator [Pararhodobacter aggregans]PVE44964.1 transcriptional regulator [Pararhodobacter aggregans]